LAILSPNTPLISIIIPCYNQGRFLCDALESVLNQTYHHWECVVVNDGSDDETEKVANTYIKKDDRIRYIKTPNSGLSAARNNGVRASNGAYIQLLDADDLLEVNKLEYVLNFYLTDTANKKIIAYSSMRYFEHGHKEHKKIVGRDSFIAHIELKQEDSIQSQKEVMQLKNPFVISAPLYPAELFSTIGFFDETLTALEDWDFHIRCLDGGFLFHHLYFIDSMTLIRLHGDSMMRNQKLLDTNFLRIISKHALPIWVESKKEYSIKTVLNNLLPPFLVTLGRAFIKTNPNKYTKR